MRTPLAVIAAAALLAAGCRRLVVDHRHIACPRRLPERTQRRRHCPGGDALRRRTQLPVRLPAWRGRRERRPAGQPRSHPDLHAGRLAASLHALGSPSLARGPADALCRRACTHGVFRTRPHDRDECGDRRRPGPVVDHCGDCARRHRLRLDGLTVRSDDTLARRRAVRRRSRLGTSLAGTPHQRASTANCGLSAQRAGTSTRSGSTVSKFTTWPASRTSRASICRQRLNLATQDRSG